LTLIRLAVLTPPRQRRAHAAVAPRQGRETAAFAPGNPIPETAPESTSGKPSPPWHPGTKKPAGRFHLTGS